jgi:hypothetical protein
VYAPVVAQALIRIDQAANTTPNGVAGVSRDDILLAEQVTVRNGNTNGVRSRRWVLEPAFGSSAVLSSTDGEAPTFTPDVHGTYRIKLSVNGGLDVNSDSDEVDVRSVIVRDPSGKRIPATKEEAEANYPVSPGVFNDEGWKPDIAAYLMALDNRLSDPYEITVNAGSQETFEVRLPDNMNECVLQYMRVEAANSTDTTVRISTDDNGYAWEHFDPSVSPGAVHLQNVTICNNSTPLTDHKFRVQVANNDVQSADYQIWIRVKAT